MARVLVTDGEQRSALAVVRSLGAAGHEVAVCSVHPQPLAGASRHCRRSFRVPDPKTSRSVFVEGVREAVAEFAAEIVIPMTDTSVPVLLEAGEALGPVRLPFPALERHRAISDKAHLTEVAAHLGVPVPEQEVLAAPGDSVDVAVERLGFPLIVKPGRSAVYTSTGGVRLGVRAVHDREELEEVLGGVPAEAYPVLLQRKIVGPGLGVFLLAWDGRTVASFAHRRLREKPPTGGVSVYRESVEVRPELRDHSEALLWHFSWRGAAMVEFKEDAATGRAYLMEINGRFWGSLQLAIDAGVDFPRLLLECMEGREPDPVTSYREGVRSRWLWGDVDHLIAVLRTTHAQRVGHPEIPGKLGALGSFAIPWRPRDRFEVLRPGDPGPFWAECRAWFAALRRG